MVQENRNHLGDKGSFGQWMTITCKAKGQFNGASENKREFQKEYKHLVKIIDRCGKKGICLEDVIVALTQNILYQNNPRNGYDPSSHHHLAILVIKLVILHYPQEVIKPKPGNMDCASLINPLVELSGYPVVLREQEQSPRFWLEIISIYVIRAVLPSKIPNMTRLSLRINYVDKRLFFRSANP
jgi:hypothetical protein